MKRVLVTGGAGFVGASIALGVAARHGDWEVIAFDNLHRRGSELNLPRLEQGGVRFVLGDVRSPDGLAAVGAVDAVVECSAEPSVLAGVDGATDYVFQTNLVGAYNCLELCRRHDAQLIFLSTSRVYPVAQLCALELEETETRFQLKAEQRKAGASARGISEELSLGGARTLYGTTKLAAELLIAEYAETFGLRAVVDRFGVIAGPWQMGKVDQGFVTYWLLAHHFRRPLRYLGFGGSGKQVRDVLHVEDAVDLIDCQLGAPEHWAGAVTNVGGGDERSVSLLELTALCREIVGTKTQITGSADERPGDIPLYISDCSHLYAHTEWRPGRDLRTILEDVNEWIEANTDDLAALE